MVNRVAVSDEHFFRVLAPEGEELWFRPKFPKPSAPAPSPAKGSGCPARRVVSGGPPKGHPCPCGGRAESLPRPVRPDFASLGAWLGERRQEKERQKLHPSLGLTKGAKKSKATPSPI